MKLFIFAVLLTSCGVYAQTGFTFLEIPVGARESALGGAGVALVTGPTSAAHNPAALAELRHSSFGALTARHFGDTRASFFSLNIRVKSFSIAPHFWGTKVPDLEYRTAPTQQPIQTFDASYSAVGVASGWKLLKTLDFGVTLRYLHSKILFENAEGWSADGGVLWDAPIESLKFGAALNHAGAVNEYATEAVELPTTFRMGAAWERRLAEAGAILVTAEGAAVRSATPHFNGGVEYKAPQFLALRVGYVTGLDAQGVSFGAGFNYKRFSVDYAFLPYKEELGEGHRAGLTVEF
ncbi:MAG: PorV/PorQ family protein [Calditrichaeota bacterium]|nr:PorV/PorQ family protein [Calditrichota bacterium]